MAHPSADSADRAGAAPLRYTSDAEPGWRRVARGKGFAIVDARGRAVRDARQLDRVRRLAIPPAWREVWICPDPDGHLQATGLDARGRKQYRYHAQWHASRGETKFERLRAFGLLLPRLRARVQRELADDAAPAPTREHVLATIARLLDTTWLRIGNAEYLRDNGSYGLSTLRSHHARVVGATLNLSFVGKAGVRHEATLQDRRVARVVRRCRELPGQELFQCVEADGSRRRIGSADVNAWLAAAAGESVTAKDFRTWHGSVQALELTLAGCAAEKPPRATEIVAAVARRLGNTAAVCRKAYIHPAVLALAAEVQGSDPAARAALLSRGWVRRPPALRGLRLAERQLLGLLRARPRRGAAAQQQNQRGAAPR
jgi:DNA topoisomerase-1